MASVLATPIANSLHQWNIDKGTEWNLGTNYTNVGTDFETYVNKYLFPKLQSTKLINVDLGNRFNFLAKETPYVSQLNEEYVILDAVPIDLNLSKEEELMLKRNYPEMATRLYGKGIQKKQKFTLNDNDNRLNWSTLGDAVKYAVAVYRKRISDINVSEETEIRAMLVDYATNYIDVSKIRKATDIEDMSNQIFETLLNIQNNSDKYNEANTASGGAIGRYTTKTNLKDVMILTTDKVKTYLLDTKIANTFQVAGIDFTDRVVSFGDLGGAWKVTADSTVVVDDLPLFRAMGDYQVAAGDVIPKNAVFTYDVSAFKSFTGNIQEIKPDSDLFAMVLDVNSIYYKRNTEKLLPSVFYNAELDEYTYWIHYYSFKAVSPFYNKIVIEGPKTAKTTA